MFTRCTPGFTCANAASSSRCCVALVAGAASTRWSAVASRSARSATSSTPGGAPVLGSAAQRAHAHVEGEGARAPRPRRCRRDRRCPSVFPDELAELRGSSSARAARPAKICGMSLLEREHRREHVLGDRDGAHAACARDGAAGEDLRAATRRRRCPAMCIHCTPIVVEPVVDRRRAATPRTAPRPRASSGTSSAAKSTISASGTAARAGRPSAGWPMQVEHPHAHQRGPFARRGSAAQSGRRDRRPSRRGRRAASRARGGRSTRSRAAPVPEVVEAREHRGEVDDAASDRRRAPGCGPACPDGAGRGRRTRAPRAGRRPSRRRARCRRGTADPAPPR